MTQSKLTTAAILANINYYSALVERAQQDLTEHMKKLQEQLELLQDSNS